MVQVARGVSRVVTLVSRGLAILLSLQVITSLSATTGWAESPPTVICQVTFDDLGVTGVAVDSSGNTIVVDSRYIMKYDSACEPVWAEPVEYPAYVRLRGVAVDASDNIVVAGNNGSTNDDVLVAKYTPAGSMSWSRDYDFDGWDDRANAVAVDSNGDIMAVGRSRQTGTPWEERWIAVKSSGSNGAELCRDVYTYDSPDPYEITEAFGVAFDSHDDAVVTGKFKVYGGAYPDNQVLTVKYDEDCDGASLDRIWLREYGTKDAGFGVENIGYGVAVDSGDKVVVAARAEGGLDKTVIRYSSGGTLDVGCDWDGPDTESCAVTSEDEIIVASETEMYQLSASCDEDWNLDLAYSAAGVAIDSSGNIIVGGESSGDGIIVRYLPEPPRLPVLQPWGFVLLASLVIGVVIGVVGRRRVATA